MRSATLLIIFTAMSCAFGAARAGERGLHISESLMAFTNSTTQGGSGTAGSTVLTHSDLVYHGAWWGLGAFLQYDKQGSSETDFSAGPKAELHWGPFYVDGGYSPWLSRYFTDRSIAKQTGYSWYYGAGVRVRLTGTAATDGGGTSTTGLFMQFSYKFRTQQIKKQDSAPLDEPITQKDGYPLFGVGLIF